MEIARDGLGVASYDGRIYAAGGKSLVRFSKWYIFKLLNLSNDLFFIYGSY